MIPSSDAVVQAMRSDLGVGRVDDLELENGHRGQGLRPGIPPGKALPIANPRNPIPLSNRWKAAIEKGEFDDDDAEMVKGLDRIGGGRLHALNSAPSFPSPNFAVRRPPGAPDFPRMSTVGSQDARSHVVSAPANNTYHPTHNTAQIHRPISQSPQAQGAFRGMPTSQSPMRNVQSPVSPAAARAGSRAMQPPQQPRPAPPTAATQQLPSKPLVPDPEPAEYFYRVAIDVADRKAKGKGVVFLVESPPTQADMLYIYLEGVVYLEYPLLSMFNYLASDTQLCPRFKEADGVSITTTALVFGSQAKMVEFMQAVKALKAKKPTVLPAPTKATVTTRSSVASSSGQHPPLPDAIPISPSAQPLQRSQTSNTLKEPPAGNGLATDSFTSNPHASVPEPVSTPAALASDLVDLSQSTETAAPINFTRSNRLSTYAMDLESLCSSPTQPASVSSSTERGSESPDFRLVPVQPPTSTAAEPSTKDKCPPQLNIMANPKPSATLSKSPRSPREVLQSCICTIFSALEVLDQVLNIFDEEDHEDIMKATVAQVRTYEDDGHDVKYLASAKILLKALFPETQGAVQVGDTALTDPVSGPRYTVDDILRLRQLAATPPQLPTRLQEIPGTTKKGPIAHLSAEAVQSDRPVTPTSPDNERRGSMLRPDAVPFKPSPDRQLHTQLSGWEVESSAPAEPVPFNLQPLKISLAEPAALPTATTTSKPSLEATRSGLGKKGLQGSRWATA